MKYVYRPPKILLAVLASFASIYAVLIAPALPFIANYFQIQSHQTHLAMVSFLLGYAFGHLPYGPLANRFGRKAVLYFGILLAIASCFLCLFSIYHRNFSLFVCARFLMAMGSCAGLNISFTIIGDLYRGFRALKMLSLIVLFSGITLGVSTALGGLMTEYLGWQSNFYFLIILGSVVLVFVYFLPETWKYLDPNALKLKTLLKNYAKECQNPKLILSAAITGCGTAMIYISISAAPFIGINLIGLAPDQYGMWAFIPSLGLIAGSLLSGRVSKVMAPQQLLWLGNKILIMASLLSLGAYFGHINPWSLFFPMLCINTGLALIFTTTAVIALTHSNNKSLGSSLIHFINLGSCVLFMFFTGIHPIKNPGMLPLLFLFLILLISFLIHKLKMRILKEERSQKEIRPLA